VPVSVAIALGSRSKRQITMPLVPLSEFSRLPATHIVSLGGQCETAYNLRVYYDFSTAYPFDWWITPLSAVITLLHDFDVDRLYDPARLEITPTFGTVFHRDCNLQLHHEFPRDPENRFGNGAGRVCPTFRDHIDKPKRRTVYLRDRLFALNQAGHRVLFVRQQVPGKGGTEGGVQRDLTEALDTVFPNAVASLALVNTRGARFQDGVQLLYIPEGAPTWHGYRTAWDEALASLEIRLDPTRSNRFEKTRANPELHAID
jgi:hypothetical protein